MTDDDDVAERMRLLRSHGMTTLTWDRHRGHASGYDVVALGFNYRIDEPRAALATARLARLDEENARRRGSTRRYRERLAGIAGDTLARRRRASPRTTSSPSCSTRGSTATPCARRCRSAASRRACTTRPCTASRSTPAPAPTCR